MKSNSYYINAAFVRGSMTDVTRRTITDKLLDIIENGEPGDVFQAIHTLMDFRNDISFGYTKNEAEDAIGTKHPTVSELRKQDLSHYEKRDGGSVTVEMALRDNAEANARLGKYDPVPLKKEVESQAKCLAKMEQHKSAPHYSADKKTGLGKLVTSFLD